MNPHRSSKFGSANMATRSNGKAAQRIEHVRATMETDLRTLSAKKGDEQDSEIASTIKQAYSRLTAASALASLCDQRASQTSPVSVLCKGTKPTSSEDFHPVDGIKGDKKYEIDRNCIAARHHQSYFHGDIPKTFPQKLMEILDEKRDNEDIITWLPHGKAFTICNRRRFASEVMPKHFGDSKYSSFIRKLNRWGFIRKGIGSEGGAYRHKDFQRGNRALCAQIRCQAATKSRMNSKCMGPLVTNNTLKQSSFSDYVQMRSSRVNDCFPKHVRNGDTNGAALRLQARLCSQGTSSISFQNPMYIDTSQNCVLSSPRTQRSGQILSSSKPSFLPSSIAGITTQLSHQNIHVDRTYVGLVNTVMPGMSSAKNFNDPYTCKSYNDMLLQSFQARMNNNSYLISEAHAKSAKTHSSGLNNTFTLHRAHAA